LEEVLMPNTPLLYIQHLVSSKTLMMHLDQIFLLQVDNLVLDNLVLDNLVFLLDNFLFLLNRQSIIKLLLFNLANNSLHNLGLLLYHLHHLGKFLLPLVLLLLDMPHHLIPMVINLLLKVYHLALLLLNMPPPFLLLNPYHLLMAINLLLLLNTTFHLLLLNV
jgi:hypothetical protein